MDLNKLTELPCYVCTTNIPKRINFTTNQIRRLGIKNEIRIQGIDASHEEGEKKILEKCNEYNINFKNFKKYGEVALAIGFIESLQQFVQTNHEHMIWFEDDIVLHPNYLDALVILEKYKEWNLNDILYLGCCWASNENQHAFDCINKKTFWIRCDKEKIWGTHAMILSKKIAKLLLSLIHTATPIDRWLNIISKRYNLIRSSLLFPIEFNSDNKINLYPDTISKEVNFNKYALYFHGNKQTPRYPCWGLIFQRVMSSILKRTKQI